MEHMVHGCQADIFVGTAIAGDIMRIEQFVVVDAGLVAGVFKSDLNVTIGQSVRHRIVRDIGQERMACQDSICRNEDTQSIRWQRGVPSTRPVVVTILRDSHWGLG